jgi:two-component sensor histidine kinase
MTKTFFIKPLFFLFLFYASICYSQPQGFQAVGGLPTKEVYDLLIDKKGFLWVAHNLGVSRYDGVTFTNFINSEQSLSAISGLLEDPGGRIWCYNFSGQVFYIQNEKMNLFKDYDSKNETSIPRMLLLNNTIYITSMDGLVTHDLSTDKTSHYNMGMDRGIKRSITNLTVLQGKILMNGNGHWYMFDSAADKKPYIRELLTLSTDLQYILRRDIHLVPTANKDTIYGILNERSLFVKLRVKGDSVKLVDSVQLHDFINTISWTGDRFWLNARQKSIALDGSEIITDGDISDILKDKEGNTWCSSLKYGLLVRYKNYWKPVDKLPLHQGDFITRVEKGGNKYVYGTQQGEIIVQDADTKNILSREGFPIPSGAAEFIKYIGNSRFIIGGSLNTFILENNQRLRCIINDAVVKDAAQTKSGLFIATNVSLLRFDMNENEYHVVWQDLRRCLQLAYDSTKDVLMARFANNVCQVVKDTTIALKTDLSFSGIYFSNGKFYLTSFNGNLYLKNDTGAALQQTKKTRFGGILNGKVIGSHIWFIKPEYIRTYDTKEEKALFNMVLPPINNKRIYDLFEENNSLTVYTSDGPFKITLENSAPLELKSYLVKVAVNNIDTANPKSLTLSYNQNHIEFYISAPHFTNSDQVYFRYRLNGSGTDWDTTENLQRVISYAALQPGNYSFEAIAVNPQTNTSSQPLTFEFEVLPPWYRSLWFKIVLILLAGLLYYGVSCYRKLHRRRLERLRKQIMADLHDDIGATLSSINIYADLAKDENKSPLLETIQANTQHAIASLNEMVWNLSEKTENIRTLSERMKAFALPLLSAKNITCSFAEDIQDINATLEFEKERNIYLIFKELVNNVAKHSEAENCTISISQKGKHFYFTVADDGKGFETVSGIKKGNGLSNFKKRAEEIGGQFTICSSLGKGTKAEFRMG